MKEASVRMADRVSVPGELMRLVADGLVGKGFQVLPPECEDSRRLAISYHGTRCELVVNDCGYVVWDLAPSVGHEADPELVAELARALLTGEAGDDAGRASEHDRLGVTFKGIVGLEAKARGLDVVLEVYKDEELFQAVAEIVVTNPGSAEGALVRVTDGGEVTWERDYWPEAAAISWEPEYAWWIADPAKAAESIVTAITQAMSLTDRVGG